MFPPSAFDGGVVDPGFQEPAPADGGGGGWLPSPFGAGSPFADPTPWIPGLGGAISDAAAPFMGLFD